jgi:hypothetical protein
MKKIIDYPGYYATNEGDIYSEISDKNISTWVDNVGYKQCILYRDKKRCYKRVHRLIAETLIPNPNKYKQVNHIDGDKLNNHVENLEWTTNSKNTQHGYDNNLYHSTKRSIEINVYDLDNKFINTYKSIRQASEDLSVNRKTLSAILFNDKTNNYPYIFKLNSENN